MATAKADLDWKNLNFGYRKTDGNLRYTFREGQWDEGVLAPDDVVPLHMASTCLHYGQECFEGLKAFETRQGDVVVFRVEENAARMARSAKKILMVPPPEDLFIDAVMRVVQAARAELPLLCCC